MSSIKVGIINVTGYAGVELARLLSRHPDVELISVTGRSQAGKKLNQVFPHLTDIELTIESELADIDLAFSAMPHQESAQEILPLLDKKVKIVDISADFRLKNAGEYGKWYGFNHPAPQLLSEAIYGLPELYRQQVASASLVANPGCYPTSAILALAPAIKENIIEPNIIIDSKSGVSGAGRSLSLKTHYSEVNEDISAYALEGHRHLPEIIQELNLLNTKQTTAITFVPHLTPMTRGILTTAYAPLASEITAEKIIKLYQEFYADEPFVKIMDSPPHTKYTWGSNMCLIYPTIDTRTGRLIIISCIDNLVKGAAGQAIQNMNLMLGLSETAGLEAAAIYP